MVNPKAFSKIFKAGDGKKGGLLAGADDYDDDYSDGNLVVDGSDTAGTFDDDFPIEPTVVRDNSANDVFAEEQEDSSKQSASHNNEQQGGGGELLMGFPSADAGSEDDEPELKEDDVDFEVAFHASFSKIGDAVAAGSNDNAAACGSSAGVGSGEGKKKGRRIPKLFKKEKLQVPVGHCGEIVVDKSKIPTAKVDLEVQNGKLVITDPNNAGEEDEVKERPSLSGGGMLKSLTKTLKSKVRGGGKDRLDESNAMNASNDEFDVDNEDAIGDSESNHQNGDIDDSKQEESRGKGRSSRRSQSKSSDLNDSTNPQRRSRRRETRLDAQKMRANSDDGPGGRMRRTKSKEDQPIRRARTTAEGEEAPMRRSRTATEASNGRSKKPSGGGGSKPRRRGDPLSQSAHQGAALRRNGTDNVMLNRRAMSTRHLNAAGEDLDRSASNSRNLSSRDRLRRATHSQRHLLGNKKDEKPMDKKEMLGNLFGGGGSEKGATKRHSTKEQGDHRRRRGSDNDLADAPIGEQDEKAEDESAQDFVRGISEEILEEGDEEEDESENPDDNATEKAAPVSVSGMSQEDVEKLIRAVAERAKDAKDEEDLEAIVMGALRGEATSAEAKDVDDCSLGSDMADYEVAGDTVADSEKMAKKDIVDKTRKYVNIFFNAKDKDSDDTEKRPVEDNGEKEDLSESSRRRTSAVDFSDVGSKLEAKVAAKKAGKARAKKRLSLVDVTSKVELVKAAKALEKGQAKRTSSATSSSTKPDFSEVVSKLEAKADAKDKARMRTQVAAK